ncbi:MAG: hypothetical protein ACLSXK_04770 [Lactococcus petauri]
MNRQKRISEAINQKNQFDNSLKKRTAKHLVKLLSESKLVHQPKRIFVQDLKRVDSHQFKQYFEGFSTESSLFFYVWIGLTDEDNVVVVGRSSFSQKARTSFGDLFKNYSIVGQSVTQEIILTILEPNKIEYLKSLEKRLNNFITKAIVIPIDVVTIDEASKKETEIGDYLLSCEVPILNLESHRNY